jgi:DNA polymerase IIIc chi subunit
MPLNLAYRSNGRAWGKTRVVRVFDRYEAAIRLEKARQKLRELTRFGFPVTEADVAECSAAMREYESATAAGRY